MRLEGTDYNVGFGGSKAITLHYSNKTTSTIFIALIVNSPMKTLKEFTVADLCLRVPL